MNRTFCTLILFFLTGLLSLIPPSNATSPKPFSEMTHLEMTDLFRKQANSPKRSIDLSGTDLEDRYVDALVSFKDISGLLKLSFARTRITSKSLCNLSEFHHLRSLDLTATKTCNTDIRLLGKLNHLERLNLSECLKLQTGVLKVITECFRGKPLRRVKLAKLGKGCVLHLSDLSLPSIESLDLSESRICRSTFRSNQLPKLRKLAMSSTSQEAPLSHNFTADEGTYQYISPDDFTAGLMGSGFFVYPLNAGFSSESDFRLKYVEGIKSVTLYEDYTRSGSLPIQQHIIVRLSYFPNLTHLDLSNLNIRDTDLGVLERLANLNVLILANNFLTIASFKTLKTLKSLTELDISRNNISDDQGLMPLPANLKRLDLSVNVIKGICLSELLKHCSLDTLNLRQVPFDERHLQQLYTLRRKTQLRICITTNSALEPIIRVIEMTARFHKVSFKQIK